MGVAANWCALIRDRSEALYCRTGSKLRHCDLAQVYNTSYKIFFFNIGPAAAGSAGPVPAPLNNKELLVNSF